MAYERGLGSGLVDCMGSGCLWGYDPLEYPVILALAGCLEVWGNRREQLSVYGSEVILNEWLAVDRELLELFESAFAGGATAFVCFHGVCFGVIANLWGLAKRERGGLRRFRGLWR